MILQRRSFLLGLAGAVALGRSRMAVAAGPLGERRLVVVLLRGALDGLAAVQPYGDPELAALRGPLALPEPGQEGGVLDLGGHYGLHPALPHLHALYRQDQALLLHAVAGPWRNRSHFIAQDFMEMGATRRLPDGWLNRALAAEPEAAQGARRGLALGLQLPLILRGEVRVGSYAPPGQQVPEPDVLARLAQWHAADPMLGPAFAEGLRSRGFTAAVLAGQEPPPPGMQPFVTLAGAAGRLLAAARGPRVAALELGGWDTHAAQAARLPGPLGALDAGMAALKENLGPAWAETAVLVLTEFGRTARVNGTGGTDHGTAGAAFVIGGAVRGGRVIADWPGLGPGRLFENRDLMPTLDQRRIAKGLLAQHLGLGPAALARAFPESDDAPPLTGLLRAEA
ncbi:DUF1501 domain-containing protein [Roseococcus sp. SDR]|uniref:DUF1501 domain-containing protein n=1 Tax=Roseococcus sp. SDR TaxID=2835532 RepID=UPI001BCE18DB|nr:DUF1501 domain-containing protein [Roseococcus sp. SDR]MBS7790934.1 DUF1501 domain-containing protein [Roseococcus sp. SDR]MBV1846248.1 DUF1501 domain-containing protein [Roseococcus sp. SDR]